MRAVVVFPRRRRWLLLTATVAAAMAVLAVMTVARGGSSHSVPVSVYPHSVAVIDPAKNTVVADVLVGGYPGPLTADRRFVYVCNIGDATVSRLLPAAKTVFDTFSLSRATDLVAATRHLWAADGGVPGHTPVPPGTLVSFEFGSAATRTIRLGPQLEGNEEQTTLATDGRGGPIWAGNADSRTVRAIDPSLGTALLTIRGIVPGGLAAVGNPSRGDTVWASDPSRREVARIDERSRRITHWIAVRGRPTRLAAGRSGVWVVTRGPNRALWRIDPTTNKLVASIPLPVTPQRVALGAGAVWVSGYRRTNHVDSTTGGMVIRIDPDTNRVVARISLGDVAADGILVSHGLVWVAAPPTP